ncbi:hypothetical protein HanLR1_Chr14g0535891 [Helianthus annuus]|nr:hypothetical protein HanHA89_Chr14g0573481 [Helianthus annuus]KAJ0656443.1 hypothetical protein HanLR1_Chr14g0535891 [Helianthus annuus]
MSSSSSSVLRLKGKTQHSDIICSCGAITLMKQSESKANPGRWYIRCVGGCGFLRWADKGEEQGCPVCGEVMPGLIDELAKCKEQLGRYKNGDVLKLKMYFVISWVLIVLLFLVK